MTAGDFDQPPGTAYVPLPLVPVRTPDEVAAYVAAVADAMNLYGGEVQLAAAVLSNPSVQPSLEQERR